MHARKLYSWCWHILVTMMAVGIVLFGMVWDVRAQESDPPPTGVPEIVGGAPSTPGEWPWQVALINASASNSNFYNAQFCGGTLIHPQWVLTAAHCITNDSGNVVSVSSVDVVAGIYNLNSPAAGFQRRDVVQIIRHPSYNRANFDNDIALLRLSPVVNIGGSGETATALIPLVPASIGDLAGRSSWATGWGNTESVPQWPQQLHEVQLPILANSICNDAAHYGGMITANMLCAGYDAGGFDACQGDSGGPLVVFDNGQWKLAGVVSFGDGCAEPFSPGIYARVSQYGNWVNGHIGQTSLVSPSGSITDYTPTYTWNAVPTMTYYYLWVTGPAGNVFKEWYTAEQAGCSNGTGTCSVTPSTSLAGGNHTWWIQTWNPAGYGPWSSGMSFALPLPAAATLVSPMGSINDETPTYTWNAVSNVT
ncbi:MAG TPA: serine protease, partial [Anaerolineales bacterium]|nr:serine protease [Anaerolineales bacterium]